MRTCKIGPFQIRDQTFCAALFGCKLASNALKSLNVTLRTAVRREAVMPTSVVYLVISRWRHVLLRRR